MDRRRLTSAGLALLSAVVVGVAAAALGRSTQRSGDYGAGLGGSGLVPAGGTRPAPVGGPHPEATWLLVLSLAVVVVVFLAGVVLFPREALKRVLAATGLFAVVVALLLPVFELVQPKPEPEKPGSGMPQGASGDSTPGIPGGGSGGVEGAVPDPGMLGLLVVGLVGVGILGVLAHRSRSTVEGESAATEDEALAAIGRSAGRAADRIAGSDATADNEVYRAWKEMTAHLDADDPDRRTPEEFRAAARDAGMAPPDVDALTDLFREVRYGGAAPTGEREAAATEALRRLEERYADEEGSR